MGSKGHYMGRKEKWPVFRLSAEETPLHHQEERGQPEADMGIFWVQGGQRGTPHSDSPQLIWSLPSSELKWTTSIHVLESHQQGRNLGKNSTEMMLMVLLSVRAPQHTLQSLLQSASYTGKCGYHSYLIKVETESLCLVSLSKPHNLQVVG